MDFLNHLRHSEFQLGDFFVPWGMVIGALGFLGAWFVVHILELKAWTRGIWNLPLFFIALAVFFGCVIGLVLAP